MAQKEASTAPEEEQQKVLEEATNVVKKEGALMKLCLDRNNLMDALKHALNMICELRTSLLSPRNYYILYMEASNQLRDLETYLLEEKHEKRMAELYELAQYAGNILPRLYLLITVGSAYIKLKEAPAKDVLRDIVEMCRGVQHPTRGLFLRSYLTEMTKDKLPDIGSEYEGRGGTVKDSVEFVLQNFTEMNKLWVRMQHQGPAREKEKREEERKELKQLIGKNVAKLSQLEGVDLELYSQGVLPRLVEQIVNCRDTIAQQYLMECIIQAFPDEFHLRNLELVLSTCSQLQPTVNVKAILVSLIDRLATFAMNGENKIPEDIQVFSIFSTQIAKVVDSQKQMGIEDILALEASFLTLTLTCYPKDFSFVDEIFKFCDQILSNTSKEEYSKPNCVKQIIKLLNTPLETYKNILTVLDLENYPKLIQYLSEKDRKKVAIDTAKNAIEHCNPIPTIEAANKLFNLVSPLIKSANPPEGDQEDIDEEQNLVASLVHLFENEDAEQLFGMYLSAKKHFSESHPTHLKYTLVPLVFRALKLAIRLKEKQDQDENWGSKAKKVFKFTLGLVTDLAGRNLPSLCVGLYLQCTLAANKCGSDFEMIAYEFFTQAFSVYEDQISDSTPQFNAISLVINTLQCITVFGEENSDAAITKTALQSSRLLKKPDQCRAIYMCSHLFWRTDGEKEYKNGKRVLECLQKSLKVADTCMDSSMNVHLFVEILNEYLYYFENECESVNVPYLSGLIAYINTRIANMDSSAATSEAISIHYQNTLRYIQLKKSSDPRYQSIDV